VDVFVGIHVQNGVKEPYGVKAVQSSDSTAAVYRLRLFMVMPLWFILQQTK
jgi:hypothetical protein